jgi:ubiquitin-like-conjugating enzyme ATG3
VPCLRRAADLERAAVPGSGGALDPKSEYALSGEDEGWTATHRDPNSKASAPGEEETAKKTTAAADADGNAIPDLADLDLADEATVSASAPAATITTTTTTTIATRTYDLSVTYDQYYRVPRMWLVGYDEAGAPLKPEQVLEDVSEDHARKTITVEPHPHGGASAGVQAASIHPCRHAEVMKRLAERAAEGGGGAASPLTIDRYLVLFLKFIASVVPTIQYDYTMET